MDGNTLKILKHEDKWMYYINITVPCMIWIYKDKYDFNKDFIEQFNFSRTFNFSWFPHHLFSFIQHAQDLTIGIYMKSMGYNH